MGQSDWFWDDGTRINGLDYFTTNVSVCQQMSWPLTYDDGINLLDKNCETGISHYICKVEDDTVFNM